MRGFQRKRISTRDEKGLERLLDGLQNTERSSRASVQEEHVGIHAVCVLLGDSLEGAPQGFLGQLGLVATLHAVEQVVCVSAGRARDASTQMEPTNEDFAKMRVRSAEVYRKEKVFSLPAF